MREPFQRLADTGLRLNAIHTLPEIQTFLVEEATELSGGERVLLIPEKEENGKWQKSSCPAFVSIGQRLRKNRNPRMLRSIGIYLAPARLTRTSA